jgi:hypothetical protein
MTLGLSALVIFQVRSCIFCLGLPGWQSYLYLLCSWGDRCSPPHPDCWLRWALDNLFWLGWPPTTILLISAFCVAGITGVHHCAWPNIFPIEHIYIYFQAVLEFELRQVLYCLSHISSPYIFYKNGLMYTYIFMTWFFFLFTYVFGARVWIQGFVLQSRHSTTWATPKVLFALVILEMVWATHAWKFFLTNNISWVFYTLRILVRHNF